jgi:hypothetical protein
LRTRLFRYLREHGFTGVSNIELSKGKGKRPNNCVHFHILTDDTRSKRRIRKLFIYACSLYGLTRGQDFKVSCRELPDGFNYFKYFTKYGYKDVILFEKGLRLQKFYKIGEWFSKSKAELWKEIKEEIRQKVQGVANNNSNGITPSLGYREFDAFS